MSLIMPPRTEYQEYLENCKKFIQNALVCKYDTLEEIEAYLSAVPQPRVPPTYTSLLTEEFNLITSARVAMIYRSLYDLVFESARVETYPEDTVWLYLRSIPHVLTAYNRFSDRRLTHPVDATESVADRMRRCDYTSPIEWMLNIIAMHGRCVNVPRGMWVQRAPFTYGDKDSFEMCNLSQFLVVRMEYDYMVLARKRMSILREELIRVTWHQSRIMDWCGVKNED